MSPGTDVAPGFRHFPPGAPIEHPSHARIGVTPFPQRLQVCTMISNPVRWRSRYRNFWAFENMVRAAGADLWVVEVAFGHRDFEVTEERNPRHLRLRTTDEIWHKENALNLLMQRIPQSVDCETYVAWVDADVAFMRPDWAQETMQLLQHYDVIQMFSHAQDLDYEFEPMPWNLHRSFMSVWHELRRDIPNFVTVRDDEDRDSYYGGAGLPGIAKTGAYMHPGYAWAARLSSLEKLGMLVDWAILGAADWHMAHGLVGTMMYTLRSHLSPTYQEWCAEWQGRAEQHIKQNVGYMPGTLYHFFHGAKPKRRYTDRWEVLVSGRYDPSVDLKRDRWGLWQLSGNNPALRDAIRAYNRARDEDDHQ